MTCLPSLFCLAATPPFLWSVSMVPFLSDFHACHVPSSFTASSTRLGRPMNANHLIELTVQEERADPLVVTASHFSTLVDRNASMSSSIHVSSFFNNSKIPPLVAWQPQSDKRTSGSHCWSPPYNHNGSVLHFCFQTDRTNKKKRVYWWALELLLDNLCYICAESAVLHLKVILHIFLCRQII